MRVKIVVAYAGTHYAGWQRQPHVDTVQGRLEAALAEIHGGPVPVTGAGRTDAGVHAAGQVAHFDTELQLQPQRWCGALNGHLPADIRVMRAELCSAPFHARRDARGKLYRYYLDPAPVPSPLLAPLAWHVGPGLDLARMKAAAAAMQGPLDQRAFATRPGPTPRTRRPIESVRVGTLAWPGLGDLVTVEVYARSFLRHVVRGMVGTLVQCGRGRNDPARIAQAARAGDRSVMGTTAPAHGLLLVRVEYPED